jgi:hypothetical protein
VIDDYFRAIDALLAESPIVREYAVYFDKRSLSRGYMRGDVTFQDDSRLHIREFVSIGTEVERMVYAYHYQRPDATLVFRYDNTPHYPDLPHAPHHRHDQSGAVIGIQPPDLKSVLQEIELLMDEAL